MGWIKAVTPKQLNDVMNVYHGQWTPEMDRCWIREEDGVCVSSRLLNTKWGKVEHVTITRKSNGLIPSTDGSAGFTWSEKQQIKDELFGENRAAVEVYPKSDRLVDVADVYHLWVFDKKIDIPFGIHPKEYQKAINRGSVPLSAEDIDKLKQYYSRQHEVNI